MKNLKSWVSLMLTGMILVWCTIGVAGRADGASAGFLGTAGSYNAFILGNFTQSFTDTEGRLAAGGDVTLNGYSVGFKLSSSEREKPAVLVAGGNLTFNGGEILGNVAYGGTGQIGSEVNVTGTKSQGTPIDFPAEFRYLTETSQRLAALEANGVTEYQWGRLTLTGTDKRMNIFSVSGSDLSQANTLVIDAPAESTVIVNVDGASNQLQYFGFSLQGISREHVLLNFSQTSELVIRGIAVEGSVLAPGAAVNFDNGQFNGTLIAASLVGGGQLNHHPFTGSDETPEPSPSPSPSVSPSPTPTPSEEASPTPTPSEEASPTPTPSEEASPTPTPSEEASPTPTPSEEASPTPTPSEEASPTPTPSEEA
ncbi:choice-of-anchor A family protein, partial [Paenibacillus sp. HN-1]